MGTLLTKFVILAFLASFCLFPLETAAQGSEIDSGQIYFDTGERLILTDKYELANLSFEKAEILFRAKSEWENFLAARLGRSLNLVRLGHPHDASDLMNSGIAEFEKHKGQVIPLVANSLHKFGIANYLENDFENAIEAFGRSLSIRKKILTPAHPDIARSLKNLGVCYKYTGSYKRAADFMTQATDVYRELNDKENLAGCYQELGEIKELAGDFNEALNYYGISLSTFKELYGEDDWDTGNQEFLIGLIYEQLDKQDLAESHINNAIRVFSKLESPNDLAICYNALGNVSQRINQDYPNAISNYLKALRLLQSSEEADISTEADFHNNLGIVYRKMKDYAKAKIHLDSSLYLRNELFISPHPRIAHSLDNIGNLLEVSGQYAEALQQYQLALGNLIPDFKPKDSIEKPSIENGIQSGSKPLLLTILADKANCLSQMAPKENGEHYLSLSLSHFELADQVIDQMRREYSAEGSKLFWVGKTRSIFEQAISLSLKLDSIKPNSGYKEKAWYFAEKSRSVLLLEGFREIEAKGLSNIPEDLIQRDKFLKNRIIQFETELLENQNGNNSLEISLKDSLLLAKRAMEDHISKLERDFPKYFRLKYDSEVVGTSELKKLLPANTLLIEYFIGEHQSYIFALSKEKFACYSLPPDPELNSTVTLLRKAISDRKFFENNAFEAFSNFSIGASSIYQKNLANVLKDFGHIEGRLIIVPDGSLNFIPFEVLLASSNPADNGFFGLDYLIKHFSINYSYSATMLMENMNRSNVLKSSNALLAFAPEYIDDPTLIPLPGTKEEVEEIAYLYSKKSIYLDDEASKEKFLEVHPQFGFIHLATHGWVDPENEAAAYLAFTHSPERASMSNDLYSYEVPGLDLSAELVVLSACETGWGKFRRGEGLMSLARSFMFAGTPSVVMSLWKTNDKASQKLMIPFHENLRKGLDKDEALRQAKLAYIKSPLDESGNPYYWAGFISIGDFHAVKSNWLKNNKALIFILLTTISLFLFLIFIRKRKRVV